MKQKLKMIEPEYSDYNLQKIIVCPVCLNVEVCECNYTDDQEKQLLKQTDQIYTFLNNFHRIINKNEFRDLSIRILKIGQIRTWTDSRLNEACENFEIIEINDNGIKFKDTKTGLVFYNSYYTVLSLSRKIK